MIVGTGTTVQTDLDIKRIIEQEIGAKVPTNKCSDTYVRAYVLYYAGRQDIIN